MISQDFVCLLVCTCVNYDTIRLCLCSCLDLPIYIAIILCLQTNYSVCAIGGDLGETIAWFILIKLKKHKVIYDLSAVPDLQIINLGKLQAKHV